MPHDFASEMNSTGAQPQAPGPRVLMPTTAALAKNALIFLAMIAFGAVAAIQTASQVLRIKGLVFMVTGLVLGAMFFYRLMTGRFELRLDVTGFSLGKKIYAWADVSEFELGKGKQSKILYFTSQGKRRPLANLYGMTGAALVDVLNQQRARPGSGANARGSVPRCLPAPPPAPRPAVHPSLLGAGAAPRKTLPVAAWVGIIAVFIVLMATGGSMADSFWSSVAPGNYAAHMLPDDRDLANRAGRDPVFLPVLLARAQHGDRSAMYFMGDLFDPTDFLCETTVVKNGATAALWYQRAVPLDDEGAERALGILYLNGIGVPQSDAQAAALLELSVQHHNDDIGDYELGWMLEHGRGEPQNISRAVQLEEASAAQNNDLGETELGRMYFSGIGVRQDSIMAINYWQQAAAQGNREAQSLLKQDGM
jgi:hypothetical protein